MEPSLILPVVLVGAGATLLTDAWALVRRRLWDVPLPDWARVGRWLANVPRGDWVLASKAPVRGERAIGWIAHYAIGIAFAAMLVACAVRTGCGRRRWHRRSRSAWPPWPRRISCCSRDWGSASRRGARRGRGRCARTA